MSAYVAAKSAQVGLTKVWAKELGPDNITVNLVQPGWIPVERHEGLDTTAYAAEVPLRRMGTPEDVAAWSATWPPTPPASSPVSGSPSTAATSSEPRERGCHGDPTAQQWES